MEGLQVLEAARSDIEAACRRYHVRRLSVFGSATTPAWECDSSDFDFLVEYLPAAEALRPLERLVGLQVALEEILKRPVDAVDWAAARNPVFREVAARTATLFYAS